MNTEKQPTEQPIKPKMGRPCKDKKSALLWVQAEFVDAMNAYLELLKQQQNKQAKQ